LLRQNESGKPAGANKVHPVHAVEHRGGSAEAFPKLAASRGALVPDEEILRTLQERTIELQPGQPTASRIDNSLRTDLCPDRLSVEGHLPGHRTEETRDSSPLLLIDNGSSVIVQPGVV